MLLDLNSRPSLPRAWEPQNENEFAKVSNAARLLIRRYYRVVIFVMICSILGGLVYLKFTPPSYTAAVYIDNDNRETEFLRKEATLSEAPIDTLRDIALAKSGAIADRVVRTLELDSDPEFETSTGGPVKLLRSLWSRFVGGSGLTPFQSAVAAVQSGTRATAVGATSSIEITFTCHEPEKAANIVNALASAFIELQSGSDAQLGKKANEWLIEQSNEMRRRADDADAAVADFIKSNNLVIVDGKLLADQNLSGLTAKLAAAKDKMLDAKSKFDRLNTSVSNSKTQDVLTLTSFPEMLQDPIIANARQQYIDISNQIEALQRDYKTGSRKLQDLLAEATTQILAELPRLLENFRNEYELSAKRYDELQAEFKADTEASQRESALEGKLKELQGVAQNYRTLYDNFLQHSAASIQEFTFPVRAAQISELAKPPQEKSWPKSGIVLAGACLGGLAFGVALGLLRDISDRTIRTGAQFEAATRIKCVGLIPTTQVRRTSLRTARLPEELLQRFDKHSPVPLWWKIKVSPNSRYVSELTAVYMALRSYTRETGARVIGVTSALPGEGKSTLVGSLAVLTAKSGYSVAIIDLDFHKGRLTEGFAPPLKFGLPDVLMERCALEDAMYLDPNLGVTVIPSNPHWDVLQPVEMLTSSKLRECIGRLDESYDYVLIDLPPLIPVADVRATADFIQGYLLTAAWAATNVAVLERAIKSCPEMSGKVIGGILNKVDFKALSKYDSIATLYYMKPEFHKYREPD